MWDLPGPGLGPVSPALAGGFLTTVPPGKSPALLYIYVCVCIYIYIERERERERCIRLTLEQHEFELHGSTYTWNFSISTTVLHSLWLVESVDVDPWI